jgi:hypothetical protein
MDRRLHFWNEHERSRIRRAARVGPKRIIHCRRRPIDTFLSVLFCLSPPATRRFRSAMRTSYSTSVKRSAGTRRAPERDDDLRRSRAEPTGGEDGESIVGPAKPDYTTLRAVARRAAGASAGDWSAFDGMNARRGCAGESRPQRSLSLRRRQKVEPPLSGEEFLSVAVSGPFRERQRESDRDALRA